MKKNKRKKTKEKKKGRKRKTPPWRESESRLSFVRDSFVLKNLHPSASGIALDEIIRYLAEGRRLALDHYARQQEKGGAKKQGRERTYEKMVRLPVGGEGAKGRRGGSGRRVDTFEEGSVDAVAPASQWLLRHSSARASVLPFELFSDPTYVIVKPRNFAERHEKKFASIGARRPHRLDNRLRLSFPFPLSRRSHPRTLDDFGEPRDARVTKRTTTCR